MQWHPSKLRQCHILEALYRAYAVCPTHPASCRELPGLVVQQTSNLTSPLHPAGLCATADTSPSNCKTWSATGARESGTAGLQGCMSILAAAIFSADVPSREVHLGYGRPWSPSLSFCPHVRRQHYLTFDQLSSPQHILSVECDFCHLAL